MASDSQALGLWDNVLIQQSAVYLVADRVTKKTAGRGALEKTAQSVKCLPPKHEDLSFIPGTYTQSWA